MKLAQVSGPFPGFMSTLTIQDEFYVCPSCGASDRNIDDLFDTIRVGTPVMSTEHSGQYIMMSDGETFVRCKFCGARSTYTFVTFHTYRPKATIIFRCSECGGIVETHDVRIQYSTHDIRCNLIFCSDEHRYEYLRKWADTCAVCGKDIAFTDDAYYLNQPVCSEGCYINHIRLKFSVEHAGVRATQKNRDALERYASISSRPYPYTPYGYLDIFDRSVRVMDDPIVALKNNIVKVGSMKTDVKENGEQHE